ncbi:hypothetical protein KM043_012330 [Ampulex compressa]|nr:hypothetical protein KM043_012330 [Ampulex compressa]
MAWGLPRPREEPAPPSARAIDSRLSRPPTRAGFQARSRQALPKREPVAPLRARRGAGRRRRTSGTMCRPPPRRPEMPLPDLAPRPECRRSRAWPGEREESSKDERVSDDEDEQRADRRWWRPRRKASGRRRRRRRRSKILPRNACEPGENGAREILVFRPQPTSHRVPRAAGERFHSPVMSRAMGEATASHGTGPASEREGRKKEEERARSSRDARPREKRSRGGTGASGGRIGFAKSFRAGAKSAELARAPRRSSIRAGATTRNYGRFERNRTAARLKFPSAR